MKYSWIDCIKNAIQKLKTKRARSLIRRNILCAIFCYLSLGINLLQASGVDYLVDNQSDEGLFSQEHQDALPSLTTLESLVTIRLSKSSSFNNVFERSKPYLQEINSHASTEEIVLAIMTNPQSVESKLKLKSLLERQNLNGGFGAYFGYASDPLSTGYVLSLLNDQSHGSTISYALSYLNNNQNADGSWDLYDDPHRVNSTAIVYSSLKPFESRYALGDTLEKAKKYLLEVRDSNHLWQDTESSARALYALAQDSDRSGIKKSITAFQNKQLDNGSFENSIYLTALGIRALNALDKPAPFEIVLSGRVLDADSGIAVQNVQVSLEGPTKLQTETGVDGHFSVQWNQPGQYKVRALLHTARPFHYPASLGL